MNFYVILYFTVHHPSRAGLPPTYVESLNHLKESQHGSDSPKPYCETPKNHIQHMRIHEDALKQPFSPFGAGDGQNHYFNQDFRGMPCLIYMYFLYKINYL